MESTLLNVAIKKAVRVLAIPRNTALAMDIMSNAGVKRNRIFNSSPASAATAGSAPMRRSNKLRAPKKPTQATSIPISSPSSSACPAVCRTSSHRPAPLSRPTIAEAPVPNAATTMALASCVIVAIPTAASSTAPNLPTIAVIKAPAIMTPDISSITGQESPTTRRSNTQSLFFMNFLPASNLARIPSQL